MKYIIAILLSLDPLNSYAEPKQKEVKPSANLPAKAMQTGIKSNLTTNTTCPPNANQVDLANLKQVKLADKPGSVVYCYT